MITFPPNPIPVVTELGDGYVLYIESGSQLENDCWTVVLCEGGVVWHFLTSQVKVFSNATYGIKKPRTSQG